MRRLRAALAPWRLRALSSSTYVPPTTPAVQIAADRYSRAAHIDIASADAALRAAYDAQPAAYSAHAQPPAGGGVAPLVPGGAESQVTSVTEWLTKADKLMRTNRREYDKTMANDYQKYATAYKAHTSKDWGKA